MRAHINPDIFVCICDAKIVLWNFREHQQYALDLIHATRFLEIACHQQFFPLENPVDSALYQAGACSDIPYVSGTWQWDLLSRIFHVGTKNIPQENTPKDRLDWAKQNLDVCEKTITKSVPKKLKRNYKHVVHLPDPDTARLRRMTLWDAFINRKTCRSYEKRKAPLDDVGVILYASVGYIKDRTVGINEFVPPELRNRRTSPSGGGLNSTEAYLVALNVEDLAAGIYQYDPELHQLNLVRHITEADSIGDLLMGQFFAEDLAFGIFLTSRFDQMWWKYPHSRAYRVSLMEVGHVSQAFQLAATSLGFRTWLSAAFSDRKVELLLDLDDETEQALIFVGGGYSDGDDLDPTTRALLKEISEQQ